MRKKWLLVLGVILVLGGGVFFWVRQQSGKKRGGMTAEVVHAKLGSIEDTVEATGEVLPLNRVEIKPPIAGRIEQLLVNEGDRVKAGQILGWMSSTDRAAIMDAARAKGPDELKHWEDTYKPTPVVAPLNGTIILRNVVVGQTVDSTIVIYAMSDRLMVKADVDETDIGRVKMGMPAVITLDSYPDAPIDGSVFQILYEGINTNSVITYPVKIDPKRIPPFFRSEMTANIKLITKKKDNVVLLPESAITPTASGERQVMVPDEKGKPVPRIVQVGLENGDQAEITDGIQDGETVLVIRKRYTPQQAAANSPLVMSGPGKGTGGGGGGRGPR
jgi:membrane fusion protein, macrolide-specific efflux system